MADGTADFTLRLNNQVTGPAKAMSRSIRGLSNELRDKQRFFAQGESEFAKKLKKSRALADSAHRQELRQMRQRRAASQARQNVAQRLAERRTVDFQLRAVRQQEAERRARQQARFREGLDQPTGGMSAMGAIGAITAVVVAATAAVGILAAKFSSATIAAVDFGQRSKTALTSILKDGTLAAQQFGEVRREAGAMGLDVTDTVDQFKMLANSGFRVPVARELVRMSADLQALTGSSESAAFALRAISQIKMKGRLQAEEITGQLAEHGVSADEVYKVLGKTLGKTREEILKMQKAGDLSADVAIPAILQAVRNQLGVEQSGGFAMKINTTSVGGMWRTLKGQVENAFISLGEQVGPGITRAFQSIMASIQAAVASPQMQAFGSAIVEVFNAISSLVGQTDFATLLKDAAASLANELRAAAVFIRDHGAEIRESFMKFVTAMGAGLKAAADFFKPFVDFANSSFMRMMLTPVDEFGKGAVTEVFNKDGSLKTPAQRAAESAQKAGAAPAGTRIGDVNFGDITVSLNGSAATPEGIAGNLTDQVRKEMVAMFQDF